MNLKKLIFLPLFILAMFSPLNGFANFSSIRNVHTTIYNQKGITVPLESGVVDTKLASMKYLLTQIDRANQTINGYASTDYANSVAAVNNPIYVSKVLSEVDEKIVTLPSFELTLTNVNAFSFQMSASGNFRVQWGDGIQEVLNRTGNTTETTYSHAYSTTGTYTIRIMGLANGYSNSEITPCIRFGNSLNKASITSISGALGRIFPTLAGVNPRFNQTFYFCTGLTAIPSGLFDGLSGSPSSRMFNSTFTSCINISSIPEDLFSSITGNPSDYMFASTFSGCNGLTSLPAGLFNSINGVPSIYMFNSTFSNCQYLIEIPGQLFASISGAPKESMFQNTFQGCIRIESIPNNLFSGIFGVPANGMFLGTFSGCTNLYGSIPSGLFGNLWGQPARYMFAHTFLDCENLSGSIPGGLFGALLNDPAEAMFWNTFSGCENLIGSIPSGLFGNLSGLPAVNMFRETFFDCAGLTGSIPSGLFGSITGVPANSMFFQTFSGCIGLQNISGGFENCTFTIGTSTNPIYRTYYGCTGITSGASPVDSIGTKFYDWDTSVYGSETFMNDTTLTDYAIIPATRK